MIRKVWPAVVAVLLTACNSASSGRDGSVAVTRLEVAPTILSAGEPAIYTWEVDAVPDAVCTLDVNSDGTPDYTPPCGAGEQAHTFAAPGTFAATLTVATAADRRSRQAPAVTVTGAGESGAFSELTFRPTASPPYGVAEGQGVSLGGKLYVFGGFDSESPYRCCRPTDRTYVFDPDAATWTPLAPLPPMNGTSFGGVNHAGFTTDGQDVYFAGGYTSNPRNSAHSFGTREAWRYNVAANTYTRLPDMPGVRGAGALEYLGGKLYYFGGSNDRRKLDTGDLYILDLEGDTDRWTAGAPLPNPRNHLGSAVLGGKIYAVGGQHKHDGALTTQNDVHAYNPATDTWEQVAGLPLAISHNSNSTFVMGERMIVVGGEVGHLEGVADVFAYSPESDRWAELTPLPKAMVDPIADVVDGRIVVSYDWEPETYIGTPVE